MQSWKLLNLETTFWHLTRYCMFTIYNTEFLAKFKANFLPLFLEWKRKQTNFSSISISFTKKSTILEGIFAVYFRKHEIYFKLYDIIWKIFLIWHTEVGLVQGFHNFSTTSDYKSRDLLFLDSTFHLETYVNIFPFFCNLRW